jgi:hypothetical protein
MIRSGIFNIVLVPLYVSDREHGLKLRAVNSQRQCHVRDVVAVTVQIYDCYVASFLFC